MKEPQDSAKSHSAFVRYRDSLRERAPQMRSYRPTFFSPTNRCWISAPSIAHFHRALALEFDATQRYDLGAYRVSAPMETGLAEGTLDCWVKASGLEWAETFAHDCRRDWCEGADRNSFAARRWCRAREVGHRTVRRSSLIDRTTLRESQRRIIGFYNESFVVRSAELQKGTLLLSAQVRSVGPLRFSELVVFARTVIPAELVNMAACEIIRTGVVATNIGEFGFGGNARLTIAPKAEGLPE